MHQDHIAVYEAGVRAGRLSMSEGHWFTPSLFVYDVAAYDVVLYPTDLRWNVFEALEEDQIDRKVDALSAYSSQAVTGPHPVNSIKQQAGVVGNARQVSWAEPFALVRGVRV
jgi:LmbE family N-acetylglucosaminyl deacetylase